MIFIRSRNRNADYASFFQLWKDYDPEVEAAAEEEERNAQEIQPLKTEYLDVIISDARIRNGLQFSVQILNTEGLSAPRCTTRT